MALIAQLWHSLIKMFALKCRIRCYIGLLLEDVHCLFIIRKLLAAKVVPVDHIFENRQTALHIACLCGQENAALALLECGASNFGIDEFYYNPLYYAKSSKKCTVKVIEALEAKGARL